MRTTIILICSIFQFSSAFAVPRPQAPSQELAALINEAIQNNSELKAGYNNWKSAESRISQAGALPDPVLGLNLMNLPVDSYEFNQEPMTGKQISLKQKLPFPGKLGLHRKIAADKTKVQQLKFLELQLQIKKQVKLQYFELFFIDKAIETLEKNIMLLSQSGKIAETRYRTGKGLLQDVLKLQVEISKLEERIIRLKQSREVIVIQLNKLLNRDSSHPFAAAVLPDDSFSQKSLIELKSAAAENRPLLLAWQALRGQSDHGVHLAQKSYLPDISLGIAYTHRDVLLNGSGGVDYISGSVSLSLPVYFWAKQKKEVEESKLKKISAQQDFENVKQQIESEIEAKFSEMQKNHQLKELYNNRILPQTRQALQSTLGAYQVSKTDFLTLLNSYSTVYNYELEYYRVLTDCQKNQAELEALVGESLDY